MTGLRWKIAGCPVNGPQSDSIGNRVVVAWFSAATETGKVSVTFSADDGASFGAPLVVSTGSSVVGYLDAVLVTEDRALGAWMEDRDDRLELMSREVTTTGEMSEPVVVTTTTRGRTGFPRMARSGDEILLAWNEKGDSPAIRVARATISR